MTTRTRGRIIALALLLIVGGVIAFSVFTAKEEPADALASEAGSGPMMPPVDTSGPVTAPRSVQELIGGGSRGQWTHTDDTGRVEMRLSSERLDPKPAGRFEMSGLESLHYLPGDKRLKIVSSRADLLWPGQEKEPESGELSAWEITLVGSVPQDAPDEAIGVTEITASGDQIAFDTALAQIESQSLLTVKGQGLALEAHGFLVRFSEGGESQRVRYLRIDPNPKNRLVIGGDAGLPAAPKPSVAQTSAPTEPKKEATKSGSRAGEAVAKGEQVDLYELTLAGPVMLTQGERTLVAERLTILLRMVDGRLRDGAIASITGLSEDPKQPKDIGPASTPAKPAAKRVENEQLVVAWGGPAEVRALQDEPGELASDDVVLRLDSTERDPVRFDDPGMGLAIRCGKIEYRATTRRVSLDVQGPATAVSISTASGQGLEARRLDVDLAAMPVVSGVVTGPARASSTPKGAEGSQITWKHSGKFSLRIAQRGFLPMEFALDSDVVASTSQGTAKAERLRATYRANPAGDRAELVEIQLSGATSLSGPEDSTISADEISVAFESGGAGQPSRPVFASAKGKIRATSREGELRSAERAALTLKTDAKGKTRATAFEASENVALRTRENVELHADRLTVDLVREVVDANGSPVVVARIVDGERAGISAGSLRIQGKERRLIVFGPGSASRSVMSEEDNPIDRVSVRWTTGMVYDDLAGHAECTGGVVGTGELGGTDRHVVRGDTLSIDLTPYSPGAKGSDRGFVAASVTGAPFDPKGTTHARAESRRFGSATPGSASEGRLEGLLAIESGSLSVRGDARTVDAPGPGRFVVEDRRPEKAREANRLVQSDVLVLGAPPASAPLTDSRSGTRGTTVFTWQGGVSVDGASGVATMHEGVRVRHKPAVGKEIVELECETITADFETSTDPAGSGDAQLRGVTASGAVFVRRGALQIVCDRVRFDVGSKELIAEAEPGNRVTIDDPERGAQVSAEAVRIDTGSGVWTEVRRGSVTLPR